MLEDLRRRVERGTRADDPRDVFSLDLCDGKILAKYRRATLVSWRSGRQLLKLARCLGL